MLSIEATMVNSRTIQTMAGKAVEKVILPIAQDFFIYKGLIFAGGAWVGLAGYGAYKLWQVL